MGTKRVVIKLSGSVFSPENATVNLKKYAQMLSEISNNIQLVVIAGGGQVARQYIKIARDLGSDEANLDMMGIEASRLNAKLLISALGDRAYPVVPKNLDEVASAVESGKIVVAGGLHPGQSTNATSALMAEKIKASRFINATDVDGIYDSDPNVNKQAKLFNKITVKKCLEILGSGNSMAGTYDLMDIVALKVIERSKIPTLVMKADVNAIKNVINGKPSGTEIVF